MVSESTNILCQLTTQIVPVMPSALVERANVAYEDRVSCLCFWISEYCLHVQANTGSAYS